MSRARSDREKNQAAAALGKLGGAKGGNARAKSLSASRRSQIAREAAQARWSGHDERSNKLTQSRVENRTMTTFSDNATRALVLAARITKMREELARSEMEFSALFPSGEPTPAAPVFTSPPAPKKKSIARAATSYGAVTQSVLDYIRAHKTVSVEAIWRGVGEKYAAVGSAVARLTAKGEIERVEAGVYRATRQAGEPALTAKPARRKAPDGGATNRPRYPLVRILNYLRDHGDASIAQILVAVSGRDGATSRAIDCLVGDGKIERVNDRYRIKPGAESEIPAPDPSKFNDAGRSILAYLKEHGAARPMDIIANLDVKAVSIRSAIRVLHDHGAIVRTHYGMYAVPASAEPEVEAPSAE